MDIHPTVYAYSAYIHIIVNFVVDPSLNTCAYVTCLTAAAYYVHAEDNEHMHVCIMYKYDISVM